ncbi:MAG: hypothetical protein WCP89_02875, partial [archaeon]
MKTGQAKKVIHWSSGRRDLNNTKVSRSLAKIVNANYNGHGPFLGVDVMRTKDAAQGFVFYTTPFDEDFSEENPQEGGLPESVRALYEDFGVKDYSELIGRAVNGV